MSKQQAFIEFKLEGGRDLEDAVIQSRKEIQEKRAHIKLLTQTVNTYKKEIDRVKGLLDRKVEEKKLQVRDEFGDEPEDIIDEEELSWLRESKDLKKGYRAECDKVKNLKVDVQDLQNNIESTKQQLIVAFEQWYQENFEDQGGQLEVTQSEGFDREEPTETFKGEVVEEIDEEAGSFKRAKKKVHDLHKAKKMERMGKH